MAEVVRYRAGSEIQIIRNFGIRTECCNGWANTKLRRRWIATKHWMLPLNTRVDDGDVDPLTVISASRQRVTHFYLWWLSVERRRARVLHTVVEMHGNWFILMNRLNHTHGLKIGRAHV